MQNFDDLLSEDFNCYWRRKNNNTKEKLPVAAANASSLNQRLNSKKSITRFSLSRMS